MAITINLGKNKSISFIPENQDKEFKINKTIILFNKDSFNYNNKTLKKYTTPIRGISRKHYIKEIKRYAHYEDYIDFYNMKSNDSLLILLSDIYQNPNLLKNFDFSNDEKENILNMIENCFNSSNKIDKYNIIFQLNNDKRLLVLLNKLPNSYILNYFNKEHQKAYDIIKKTLPNRSIKHFIKYSLESYHYGLEFKKIVSSIKDYSQIKLNEYSIINNNKCNISSYANNIIFKNLTKDEILNYCTENNLINTVYKQVPIELTGYTSVHKDDYLQDKKLEIPGNREIIHGLTCPYEKTGEIIDKIFESNGLESINIRSRKNGYIQGLSPIGDIASGIDNGIPFNISNNAVHGNQVFFILKEEVLYRRDIKLAPSDFGSGERRHQFKNYAKELEYDKELKESPSHYARNKHLLNIKNKKASCSNEIYFKDKISFNEIKEIRTTKKYHRQIQKLVKKHNLDIKIVLV